MRSESRTILKKIPILRSAYASCANFIGTHRNKKRLKDRALRDIFSDYHRENFWGNDESVSGPGSTLQYTEKLRKALPGLLKTYEVGSILDAPCGDYNWFRLVERPANVNYVGADIVLKLIEQNRDRFEDENTKFQVLDITKDHLPSADLWICRDALFHLSHRHVLDALNNFLKSDLKFLLATSNVLCPENKDILSGQHRLLNLQLAPFNLPAPLLTLDDGIDGEPVRKMCLWERKTLLNAVPKITL